MAVDVMGKERKETMRLDKFLGEMGKGTRSQIKEMVRKGRIMVNGMAEKKPERKINPETDEITLDGCKVAYQAFEYYMLYKPQGVVSATEDSRYQTVTSLIDNAVRKDLFPVGRLDIDTEGLLLITNDGDLAHRLLSPRHHVDKTYYAHITGSLPADAVRRFQDGIVLEDGTTCMPARLKLLFDQPEDGKTAVTLTIQEGKFHQVKRMFEAVGCQVVYLKRLSMGPLVLDKRLQPGAYRPLTDEEVSLLKNRGDCIEETDKSSDF